MAQRWKLKNARWRESDQQVRVIVDLILGNVMAAIDFRATAAEIVFGIVDDAMSASDDVCLFTFTMAAICAFDCHRVFAARLACHGIPAHTLSTDYKSPHWPYICAFSATFVPCTAEECWL
jgi:hypothetical protein